MLQKTYTRSKKNFKTLEFSCLHYNNETLPFFEIFFLPQKKPKSVVHPPNNNNNNKKYTTYGKGWTQAIECIDWEKTKHY